MDNQQYDIADRRTFSTASRNSGFPINSKEFPIVDCNRFG
jgi:hypothetical protein